MMKSQLTTLALLIAYANAKPAPPPAPAVQAAAQAPAIASIQIGQISYSGSGCPSKTVTSMLSDDKSLVTFGFDQFQATIGPQSKPGDSRKNCNLQLQLLFQDGFQMAVAETVYHGYTRLDDGVNAKFTTDYDYKYNPKPGKKVSDTCRLFRQHGNSFE
jgi:hypothetical protein